MAHRCPSKSASSLSSVCGPPLVMFIVILSIGEALWSPRLYEYTAMIAPKGREGTYMALASAPNFAAKLAVGGLSGTLYPHAHILSLQLFGVTEAMHSAQAA